MLGFLSPKKCSFENPLLLSRPLSLTLRRNFTAVKSSTGVFHPYSPFTYAMPMLLIFNNFMLKAYVNWSVEKNKIGLKTRRKRCSKILSRQFTWTSNFLSSEIVKLTLVSYIVRLKISLNSKKARNDCLSSIDHQLVF